MECSEKRELSEDEEENWNPANASNRSAQSGSWYPSRSRFTLNLGSISPSLRSSGNRPITGSRSSATPVQERNRTETTPFSHGSAAIREYGEERNSTEMTPFSRGSAAIREYGEERNKTKTTHLEEINTKEDKLLIINDHRLKVIYI